MSLRNNFFSTIIKKSKKNVLFFWLMILKNFHFVITDKSFEKVFLSKIERITNRETI
jgi:hypothetical protein